MFSLLKTKLALLLAVLPKLKVIFFKTCGMIFGLTDACAISKAPG